MLGLLYKLKVSLTFKIQSVMQLIYSDRRPVISSGLRGLCGGVGGRKGTQRCLRERMEGSNKYVHHFDIRHDFSSKYIQEKRIKLHTTNICSLLSLIKVLKINQCNLSVTKEGIPMNRFRKHLIKVNFQ